MLKSFGMFVESTAVLMCELIPFEYSYAVRKGALKTVNNLFLCCETKEQMSGVMVMALP
jgi:hypothetical protein